jgi:RNA polymerase sigma-70 factor (ECF subfamily)
MRTVAVSGQAREVLQIGVMLQVQNLRGESGDGGHADAHAGDRGDTHADDTAAGARQSGKTDKAFTRLIKRAMRGDKKAVEQLCRIEAPTVLFHIHSFLDDKSAVEDVAQEAFVRLASGIHTLEGPYAFKVWLRSVVVNCCRNHNRRHHQQAVREQAIDETSDYEDTDEGNMPEAVAQRRDIREELYRHILKLPAAQLEVVLMYYFDEMSYKEIAQALAVNIGTVSSNLIKARRNLKVILEQAAGVPAEGLVSSAEKSAIGAASTSPAPSVSGTSPVSGATVVAPAVAPAPAVAHSLSGLALGPAIASALDWGATQVASPEMAEALCEKSLVAIQAAVPVAVVTTTAWFIPSFLVSKSAATVVATVAAISVATGGAVTAAVLANEEKAPTLPVAIASPAPVASVAPAADIALDGTEGGANPTGARLILSGDGVETEGPWIITDAAGTIVARGDRMQMAEVFLTLAPGTYRIAWQVKDTAGGHYRIQKDFTVVDRSEPADSASGTEDAAATSGETEVVILEDDEGDPTIDHADDPAADPASTPVTTDAPAGVPADGATTEDPASDPAAAPATGDPAATPPPAGA